MWLTKLTLFKRNESHYCTQQCKPERYTVYKHQLNKKIDMRNHTSGKRRFKPEMQMITWSMKNRAWEESKEREHSKKTSPRTRQTQGERREGRKSRWAAAFIWARRTRVDGATRRGPRSATAALVNALRHRGTPSCAIACGATEWYSRHPNWRDQNGQICKYFF
jgi:hypothetical protein